MMRRFVVWLLLLISVNAWAGSALRDLHITNPQRSVGYVVGDIFKRTLELEIAEPYTLTRSSLPAQGITNAGLELRNIKIKEKRLPHTTRYQIEMTYQVFARSSTASKLRLPTQFLRVTANGKAQTVPIPGWNLRISPLAAVGEIDIENDMSPFRAPLRVETSRYQLVVALFLSVLFFAVLGLIYINADNSWFPGMGGPFAASYRKLMALPDSNDGLNTAVASIQAAFNATFNENLFPHDLDLFFARHPKFRKLKHDIEDYFAFYNGVFFGVSSSEKLSCEATGAPIKPQQTIARLIAFCRACRDCERGLA